jgi:hypothetical protein
MENRYIPLFDRFFINKNDTSGIYLISFVFLVCLVYCLAMIGLVITYIYSLIKEAKNDVDKDLKQFDIENQICMEKREF